MSGTQPNLPRMWEWVSSAEATALREGTRRQDKVQYKNTLISMFQSVESEALSRWDKHCAVTNLDLLPENIKTTTQELRHTTLTTNNTFQGSLDVVPDSDVKYSLIYPSALTMKRKKFKEMNTSSQKMNFLSTATRMNDGDDDSIVTEDEEVEKDLMKDIEPADDPEPDSGIKRIPMDLLRLRYGKVRFPPQGGTSSHTQAQRRFFWHHPDHPNANNTYWPWNRIPDDDILGTDHCDDWRDAPEDLSIKERIENWYRTHREKPFPNESLEEPMLNRKFGFEDSRDLHDSRHESQARLYWTSTSKDENDNRPQVEVSTQLTLDEELTIPSRLRGGAAHPLEPGSHDKRHSKFPTTFTLPQPWQFPEIHIPASYGAKPEEREELSQNIKKAICLGFEILIGGTSQALSRASKSPWLPFIIGLHEQLRLNFNTMNYPSSARPYPVNIKTPTDMCPHCKLRGLDLHPKDYESHRLGICPFNRNGYLGDLLDIDFQAWQDARAHGLPLLSLQSNLPALSSTLFGEADLDERLKSLPPGRQATIGRAVGLFQETMREFDILEASPGLPQLHARILSDANPDLTSGIMWKSQEIRGKLIEEHCLAVTGGFIDEERDDTVIRRAKKRKAKSTWGWRSSNKLDEWYISDLDSDSDDGTPNDNTPRRSESPISDIEENLDEIEGEIEAYKQQLDKEFAQKTFAGASNGPPPGYTKASWEKKLADDEQAKADAAKNERQDKEYHEQSQQARKQRKEKAKSIAQQLVGKLVKTTKDSERNEIIKQVLEELGTVVLSSLDSEPDTFKEAVKTAKEAHKAMNTSMSTMEELFKGLREAALKAEEEKRKAEEEAWKRAQEESRNEIEAEAARRRKKAAEDAKKKAEEEARKKAEEEAAEEARKKAAEKAAEDARKKAEEEATEEAAEEARKKAEEEAAEEARKKKAEEEAAEEARKKAEEEEAAEEARKKAEEEEAKKKAEEEEAKKKAEEEEAKKKAEEEARQKKGTESNDGNHISVREETCTHRTYNYMSIGYEDSSKRNRTVVRRSFSSAIASGGTGSYHYNFVEFDADGQEQKSQELEGRTPSPPPTRYLGDLSIQDILWKPNKGPGNSHADDVPDAKLGWRKDGRTNCPICGALISRLSETLRNKHLENHGALFSNVSDYFLSPAKSNKRGGAKFIDDLKDNAKKYRRSAGLEVMAQQNEFRQNVIRLHRAQKDALGDEPEASDDDKSDDENDDDDDESNDGDLTSRGGTPAAGRGRARPRGRRPRPSGGSGPPRRNPRRGNAAGMAMGAYIYAMSSNHMGIDPYESHSVGGYYPPSSRTIIPAWEHVVHVENPSYKKFPTGDVNPKETTRNWRLLRGTSPEIETVEKSPPPNEGTPLILKEVNEDGQAWYNQINAQLARDPNVKYAHKVTFIPRHRTQGFEQAYPLETEIEFCNLKRGILKAELDTDTKNPRKAKRRRTITRLFDPLAAQLSSEPAEVINETEVAREWTWIPDTEHHVADKPNYWELLQIPGAGIEHPVQRYQAIRKEFPAPILGWTQEDGTMDFTWIDPDIVSECGIKCPRPPIRPGIQRRPPRKQKEGTPRRRRVLFEENEGGEEEEEEEEEKGQEE